jgi:hypothetical protein
VRDHYSFTTHHLKTIKRQLESKLGYDGAPTRRTVLPTPGRWFRPNQPKISAEHIIFSLILFYKEFLCKTKAKKMNPSVDWTVRVRRLSRFYSKRKLFKSSAFFLSVLVKSAKNSATDFSGRWDFYWATFVFCGRNICQLATLKKNTQTNTDTLFLRWGVLT